MIPLSCSSTAAQRGNEFRERPARQPWTGYPVKFPGQVGDIRNYYMPVAACIPALTIPGTEKS
jgi:hypothetical protein